MTMDLKEAKKLADRFTEWVCDLLKESAEGANQTIRWFIKTLYKEGYEIRKKRKRTLIDKNEAKQAIKRIDRIIQEWEENNIESREMVELLVPDLKIITTYFERTQDSEE